METYGVGQENDGNVWRMINKMSVNMERQQVEAKIK